MYSSQYHRRRSDPGHGNYYGSHEGYMKRPPPTGGYGYGQNMGYNYEAGPGYTKVGGGQFSGSSIGPGAGRGRAPAPERNGGRLEGPGDFGNSGYSSYSSSRSANVGRNGGDGYQGGLGAGRGFPNQERGRGGRGGEGGGYRGGLGGGPSVGPLVGPVVGPPGPGYGRGRGGDGGFGGRGRGRSGVGEERGRGGQRGQSGRGQSGRGQGRGSRGGRGRGGRVPRETVKFNCIVKIEKLPLEMSLQDLKVILGDVGFDPKLFIAKIMKEEDQKVAIVKIVEEGSYFIEKMDDLEINGSSVKCSILEEEEISQLLSDGKTSAPSHSGFYVSIQFCKFAEIPTQDEIQKIIIQAGLESPQKWQKPDHDQDTFSVIVAGEEDQKEKIKTALKDLYFGVNIDVSVKEVRKKEFAVKVFRKEPSIHLTNVPLDCDGKKLKAAIRKNLVFDFGIKGCKDGEAEISYTVREMDLVDKLNGMKIGDNVLKVVEENLDDNFVIPDDWTEDKVKEVLGIEKLVPIEIKVKDEMLALLFKPSTENLPTIIQELAKLRPQPAEPAVEEEVKDEELKEKEVKEDKEEKEEAPQMIDGKPVVFACSDIREKKKAQAQAEEAEETNANIINANESEEK